MNLGRAARLTVAVALSLMALCGGGPALAAGAAPDCSAGTAALRAGQPQRAADLLAAVRPQTAACVVRGRTAAVSLLKAESLLSMGMRADADEMIKRALEAEPDLTVPDRLRPNTVGPAGIKLAKTLERDGYHAAAVDVLQKVIENDPDIRLDHATQEILGRGGHPWYWYVKAPFTSPATKALAPWALIALVVGLVIHANCRKRLYFQPFSGVDEDGDRQATALRALIRSELHRLARESAELPDGRRFRLDQAGPYEDDVPLESVADELPQGKLIGAALALILRRLPSRSRLVNGIMLSRPGVVLSIERRSGKLEHTEAIHHSDLDFPGPGQNPGDDELPGLALAGAVWIILSRDRDARLGGTRRWDSYLAFAAGCAWQAKGDLARARLLYARACDDPENTAAAVNLAAIDQLDDQVADPRDSSAYHRLEQLYRSSEPGDLHRYRALYLMSSALCDRVDETSEPAFDQADARTIQIPGLAPPRPRSSPEQVAQFLEEARNHAITLARDLEEQRRDPAVPREFAERNRAAALTLIARQARPVTTERAAILAPAPHVEITEENLGARLAELAPGTAESLVEFATGTCVLDEQAHFNLYRYYSKRAENLAATIDEWQARTMGVWAAYDGRLPDDVAKWVEDTRVWLDTLEERYQEEQRRLQGHREQATAAHDTVLTRRVQATPTPYRPVRSHHPDYGTERQRPPRDTPPPEPAGLPDVPTHFYEPADDEDRAWVDDLLPAELPPEFRHPEERELG